MIISLSHSVFNCHPFGGGDFIFLARRFWLSIYDDYDDYDHD